MTGQARRVSALGAHSYPYHARLASALIELTKKKKKERSQQVSVVTAPSSLMTTPPEPAFIFPAILATTAVGVIGSQHVSP